MESTKTKFLTHPNKDPKTGKSIKIGGKEYKYLEEKYGTPKIKSPKTLKKISVNKGEYKKLIKDGYTEDQLLYGIEKNEPIIIVPDAMREILLRADVDTIEKYCQTNKNGLQLCDDTSFWRDKFAYHHFYFPLVIGMPYTKLFQYIQNQINNVNIILKINEIEKNRTYNKTKGIIKVRIEDMDADNWNNLLSTNFEKDKYGDLNFNSIVFELTDKGYMVKLEKINESLIDVGYKNLTEIKKIFSYALTDIGICEDDKYISFLSMDDEAFDEQDIAGYYVKNTVIASVRRGLWEGMLS